MKTENSRKKVDLQYDSKVGSGKQLPGIGVTEDFLCPFVGKWWFR